MSTNGTYCRAQWIWGRAQWIWGRASDSRLRKPGFESFAAMLKLWVSFFHSTLPQLTQLYK